MLDLVWYCYILLVTESMENVCSVATKPGCAVLHVLRAVIVMAALLQWYSELKVRLRFWDLNDLGWSDGLWCTVTSVACTTCAFQALRAASGRVKQDSDGSWMDSLLFCYMCSLLHRQKYVVALFCETKKEFCGTYEHFIKFFHSHPKQWSNVKHIHSICRMRIFYDWLVAGRGPDGGPCKNCRCATW